MRRVLILATAALLLVAACGSGPPAGPQPGPSSGAGTGTATTGGPPSTPVPSTPVPSTTVSSTTPPPTGTATRCGPQTFTATTREQPAPRCLSVGASLRITTEASPHQPWNMPVSSDDTILRCVARPLADGAADATCTALRHGNATITTATGPFAGDPHGPPQSTWQLSITVI